MKVELSNGRSGSFILALSGWQINEPIGSEALKWTVFGKQSGDVQWDQPDASEVVRTRTRARAA